MRIIGPPYYKPEVTCLKPPFSGETMHKARLREDRERRLQEFRRKREASLRCPECGDSMKVSLFSRWFCQHCLIEMTHLGVLSCWHGSCSNLLEGGVSRA
jgi:hypothetical protein